MREYPYGRPLGFIRRLAFIVAIFSASIISSRQTASPQSQPPASAATLHTTTHLVLVDVVVYDKHGNHVTNLTAADFTLHDHGQPQNIAVFFNEHAGESPIEKAPPPPPLPPDVSTNRPEYHPLEGPPTILLLDALNTAVS